MRKKEVEDRYTVEYPNATHFAFVPAIVRVNYPELTGSIIIFIQHPASGIIYEEVRDLDKGRCVCDIRRYFQIALSNIRHSTVSYDKPFNQSPLIEMLRCGVNINGMIGPNASLCVFYTDAIWGAISPRESSAGTMRRRWFVNYPFTLDVFARNGTEFDVQIDGGRSDMMFYCHEPDAEGATRYNRYLMNPARLIDTTDVERTLHIAVPHSLVLHNDTESVGMMAYTLDIDRSTQGVYLRWIDRQGRYCYYLFRDLGSAAAISATSTWERNDMITPTAYEDGINIETPVRQQFAQRTTRSLGARLVDAETYDFLLSLTRSVVVDVLDGYDPDGGTMWHRVNVIPASFERTTKRLQDFVFSIEEPQKTTQSM